MEKKVKRTSLRVSSYNLYSLDQGPIKKTQIILECKPT